MTEMCEVASTPENYTFELSSHANSILSGLNELRLYEKLLDVTLIAEDAEFKVHRAVMAACSDYFRAMFTDAMKEANQAEICLKGVTARGIECLINYAYTSKLKLDRNNVQDILSAANHVQMNAVIGACANFLESQIDLENCVDIATIAEIYSLEKLKQKTYKYICSRLKTFSKTNEINRLTWEQFLYLLSSDYPVDCPEANILQIVINWCIAQNVDHVIIQKLINKVRLDEIKHFDLESTLRLFRPHFSVNQEIYFTVLKIVERSQPINKFNISTNNRLQLNNNTNETHEEILTNSRGMESALIKIGGFGVDGITNKITYYLPSRKKWHNLTVIPHVEQSNYGTAVLGNDLYVVGGCYDVYLKEYIHPFGFRYCPIANKWTTIAPMQNDRCRFSLNAIGSCLYAVGGVSDTNESDEGWIQDIPISNCEKYNTNTDTWEYIVNLPENRTQHAGAVLGCNLYISGGLDRHRILSSFWRYNTFYEKWEELPPMLVPRTDHNMLAINNKLYVCGGWYEDLISETRRLVRTIDSYDPVQRTWIVETEVPTPKYHAGIVAVNNVIYIVGGLHSDTVFDRASSAIQCFNIETKEWSRLDGYPESVWECSCVSLFVPKCREDLEVLPHKKEPHSDK
ncbi:kelch-like protein 26 [Condylostylus longicornis]|uniref:kelch-like protein 26 n=1 Tax=Condylostylus longicornis TaxID=2530218 RepID=UPI00244E3D8C|nr:kelch-like protein 26 [Condylostylus longicornis]